MLVEAIIQAMTQPRAMSPKQLRAALRQLDINQLELARRLDVDGRTVRRWVSGGASIPGPVRAALHSWQHLDDLRRLLEREK